MAAPSPMAPVIAAADLCGRSGATRFQIGYTRDEDDPDYAVHGAGWYAEAYYRGARLFAEGNDPNAAATGLAHQIIEGAKCVRCGMTMSVGPTVGCRAFLDGERWGRTCEGGS